MTNADGVDLGDGFYRYPEVRRIERDSRWNAEKLSFFEVIKNQNVSDMVKIKTIIE